VRALVVAGADLDRVAIDARGEGFGQAPERTSARAVTFDRSAPHVDHADLFGGRRPLGRARDTDEAAALRTRQEVLVSGAVELALRIGLAVHGVDADAPEREPTRGVGEALEARRQDGVTVGAEHRASGIGAVHLAVEVVVLVVLASLRRLLFEQRWEVDRDRAADVGSDDRREQPQP